jgi:pimeloyl-ACP methyl ester carboxylesterase
MFGASFVALRRPGPRSGVVVAMLPGLGGSALSLPRTLMDRVGAAVDADVVLAATYATPFGPSLNDAAAGVWAALVGAASAGVLGPPPWRLVLFGYSMGGMVAQAMATRVPTAVGSGTHIPTLTGVVLVSTGTPVTGALPVPTSELMAAARNRTPDTPPAGSRKPRAGARGTARLRTMFPQPWLDTAPADAVDAMSTALASGRVAPEVRAAQFAAVLQLLFGGGPGAFPAPVCVLVLHGSHDRVLDVAAARRGVARAVAAGPAPVTFHEFPHAGHGLPFQDPRGVAAAVASWWRGCSDGSAGASSAPAPPPAAWTISAVPTPAVLYLPPAMKGAAGSLAPSS